MTSLSEVRWVSGGSLPYQGFADFASGIESAGEPQK
jgi:hypothetical protein